MSENYSVSPSAKIKCLIDMALTNEISWLTLSYLIDNLAPTLKKSKEIIKIILKEFEEFQSKQFKNDQEREQVSQMLNEEENQSTSKDILEEDIIESEEFEEESVVPENAPEARKHFTKTIVHLC